MTSLYDLTGQLLNLQNALSDFTDNEDCLAAIEAAMAEVEGSIEEKATGYGKIIRNLESSAAAAKAEADRLSNKAKAYEHNAKRLKAYLYASMEAIGKDKIKTDLFTFAIQNNPPSVDIGEDFMKWALGNDRYLRYKDPEVDKKAILADIKAGIEVPYATLIQSRSLRMR